MKKILFGILGICFCSFLLCPAFAAAPETPLIDDGSAVTSVPETLLTDDDDPELLVYTGSYQEYSDSDGLKGVLLDFLGDWDCVTVHHSFSDSAGNVVTTVETLPDYPWIASAVLLSLMVFCLFRIGGGLICNL